MSLQSMLAKVEEIKQSPFEWKLHLGCGRNYFNGFTNIDKYEKAPWCFNYDVTCLPYDPCSIDLIYSSHMIEHLNIRDGRLAIRHWANLLKSSGKLYLALPDLEEIMRLLLTDLTDEKRDWYMYTLFGYQADTNMPFIVGDTCITDEPGQHHKSGYSKKTLLKYVTEAGLKPLNCYSYDGYSTPSIWLEATK